MTAEKIDAAYAKTVMDDANSKFQTAYDRFFAAAHGGSGNEFKAAKAEYDRAFKAREKALKLCGLGR